MIHNKTCLVSDFVIKEAIMPSELEGSNHLKTFLILHDSRHQICQFSCLVPGCIIII
jgi:hypothetical protein